jgi:hypothetical protein
MKDRKNWPSKVPINEDAARLLRPMPGHHSNEYEKKHRRATTAIDMTCLKGLHQ